MEKITNKGDGPLGFKDDEGKKHTLKPGESVECKYKKSMDARLVIETKPKARGK